MSAEEGNANQGLYSEEDIHDTEDDVESGTTKGSSSNSSTGTNHHQQDQVNSDMNNMARAMNQPPMLQGSRTVAGPSNAEFMGAQHQQQPIANLPSTPSPATSHSIAPATMNLLPVIHHHGQNMSPVPHNQLVVSQQNPMHNEQFHVPANQTVQNIRAPYTAIMNTYSHSSSNVPADYGFNDSPRPQMPIGNIPNFMEHLLRMQRGYQQMVHNPSFTLYGPPQPNSLQAAAYPAGGPPLSYHPFMLPNIPNPQARVVPDDQPLNWAPPALGNQNQPADRPGTSAPRCTNSLYDPSYAEMGLPIDPHLRMFLASLNQGKDSDNGNN